MFKKQHYFHLRQKLRDRGFGQAALSLSLITGRSESYMSACLAGKRSFQPKEMEKILNKLNIDKQDAMEVFPPFGIDRPFLFVENG